MEKNKNRTDLLAAGRKKLQQFRKKKESKGSSHEKSSNKTSNSENEVDADVAPAALKLMASPKADEGETASPHGADVGSVDSSVSHSMVNSVASDAEMSALDLSIPPIAAESGRGDILPDSDAQLAPSDLGEGEAVSIHSADIECVIESSVPLVMGVVDDGESIRAVHDEVGHVNSMGTSETEFVHDDASLEVSLLASPATTDTTEGVAAPAKMEETNKEEEEKDSLPSQEDISNMSLIPAGEDQDADCSGSKQCDGSTSESHGSLQDGDSLEVRLVSVELERDGGLVSSEHVESAENLPGAAPEGRGTKEAIHEVKRTNEVDDVSVSSGAIHEVEGTPEADGLFVSVEDLHKEEGRPAIDPEMMSDPRKEDGMSGSSNEENLEILSLPVPGVLGTESKGGFQANMEQNRSYKTVEEVYTQQYLPKGSVIVESKSHEKPFEAKKESSYKGKTFPFSADSGSVDLYQLAEIVRELEEEEVRFLLKSRESASKAEIRDMGCLIIPEYGFVDILESFKEQLYFTSVAKDFLQVQLTEQVKLQMEFDRRDHQLVDEVSKLNAFLKETRERNTSLSEELAQCRSELQAVAIGKEELQNQFLTARKDVEEFTAKVYELQIELESSHKELTSLSTELADCKGLVAALQMENASLNGSLSLVTEERKKLEEEKEYFVHENEDLSSVLVEHQERLATEHGKYMQLELELKEVILRLEQLTEENIFLSSSLDIHKAKVKEIDNRHIQLSSQAGEAGNQVEGYDVSNTVCETDDEDSHQSSGKYNCEVVVGKSLSLGPAERSPHQQLEGEVSDDSVGFKVLKGHLEEAEKIMQKLEMAIEGMHSHSESLSRSAGKVAASGVSKLIQAFESKVHNDDTESEEMPLVEDRSAADQFKLAEEQTRYLRAVLKELYWDAEKANELFREEHDSRKLPHLTLREFGDQCESSKQHSSDLEAKNRELEVLYDALKQQASSFEAKNNEFKVLYEASMQKAINLEARNSELVKNLADYQSRIGELQHQLYEIQQSSDEMAATIITQLENLQKEAGENASSFEQEWSSTVDAIVETVGKLDSSTGGLFTSSRSTGPFDGSDLSCRVSASVDAATKLIEDLHGKLEAAYTDQEAISCSYKELNEKFSDLHAENELAVGLLVKIYGDLRKLVNDFNGYVEESEKNVKEDRLHDLLQPRNYETLIEQLGNLLGEKLRLEYVNNELMSELINRKQDIEELNKRCLDSRAILKLVEDVERIVKSEDMEIDSDKPPVSRLESSITSLIQKFIEASEQVTLSREEFGYKMMELSELQGKMQELSSLNLQREDEIHIIKGSLGKVEEALEAVRIELRAKAAELEQSEQKVSSAREKLSIAVAKGKGLIVQRDNLKHSLAETSSELDRCSQELHLKDARLREVETKLKAYSEAGERVEALESELSYIRNSATALRESFLLKDSVLQRIEEILEDLELPEHFHSRDIIEKIEWLARSVAGNTLPLTDWDQKSSGGGGSYSDAGFVVMDAWKEDVQQNTNTGDELRRQYEELQSRFYGLAEQNEMLEQSLMERNNLVQRWEEVLDRINMPLQLRSMEPEDRIEWLGSALSEAHHDRDSLQYKIDNLETSCGSLTADLEESQRKIHDLEASLQAVIREREHLSESLENFSRENGKLSEKEIHYELEKDNLLNEVTALHEKLAEKLENNHHIEGEIMRLQVLVSDALQDPGTQDTVSGERNSERLEVLLRKLIENYTSLSLGKLMVRDAVKEHVTEEADMMLDERKTEDALDAKEIPASVKEELEEALGNLTHVKVERDEILEKHQFLVSEVEAVGRQKDDLQERLNQEEQKSASTREKLNVAVRKGKGLVQQRDSLKQTIGEMNSEVERLKCELNSRESAMNADIEHLRSELNRRESALVQYEQMVRDLSIFQQKVETLESESLFLRNRLTETEQKLQESEQILSMLLKTLHAIDVGSEFDINDPAQKLEGIGILCHDLHAAVASSKHEAMKSRRAADLLVAELNDVQERTDGLQEELAKADDAFAQLSKERDAAEAARLETLSRLEKFITVRSNERKNQYAEVMELKAGIDQLRKGCLSFNNLLANVFSKDLELLHNVEAGIKLLLKQIDGNNVVDLPLLNTSGCIFSGNSVNEVKFPATGSLSETKMLEHFDESVMIEVFSLVGRGLQECATEIDGLKEKFYKHFTSFNQQVRNLSNVMETVHREIASQKKCFESLKRDINRLESMEKEKDTELIVMRRGISLLYGACTSSILEIENRKAQLVENGLASGVHVLGKMDMNLKLPTCVDGREPDDGQALSFSEEHIRIMADTLLWTVKGSASIQSEIEGSQKELKATIFSLQKELQEKDIQKNRICAELVSQIKEAEAAAKSSSLDLEAAKTQLHNLEKRVEVVEKERSLLELRVRELQDGEATSIELQEKIRSLNDLLTAKEQEIEALMQALDEEEAQLEGLTNKIEELEKVVQQKNLDLENLENSRKKGMAKLSITVSKFDELHHLSENLLSEVENLQSQVQGRDAEISFLRQEVTRCTNDVLASSQETNKRNSNEIHELLTWFDMMISRVEVHDVHLADKKCSPVRAYKDFLEKKVTSIISELEDLRVMAQSKDAMLQVEKSRAEELLHKGVTLENSLREKESQLALLQGGGDSGQVTSMTCTEILEVEPMISKRTVAGTSIAPHARSVRKVNNDQVAIGIDVDPGSSTLDDEDDDKVHGFKSLTTSRIVPRFTRPVSNMIDGLWVSCDRALMRQPALRLGQGAEVQSQDYASNGASKSSV